MSLREGRNHETPVKKWMIANLENESIWNLTGGGEMIIMGKLHKKVNSNRPSNSQMESST